MKILAIKPQSFWKTNKCKLSTPTLSFEIWVVVKIHDMGSRKDSMDTKFEEDMQKALALSMESAALEKFRNSKIEGKKTQKNLQNVNVWFTGQWTEQK